MKFKKLNQIGMALIMTVIFGCSKQDAQPTTETSNQQTAATPTPASNQNQETPAPAPTVTSNQEQEATSPQADTSNEQPTISLSCLYSFSVSFGNGNVVWLVSEYKNTGNVGIRAFKGTWTLVDDLGDSQGQQEDKFTSDTPFIDTVGVTNSSSASHLILPGETIELINKVTHLDDGDQQEISATTKGNLAAIAASVGFTNLDDIRGDRKFTFEIEKIVPQ